MSSLEKSLNVYRGIGILVSTLLGSSIFIIPAIVATIAGIHSLLAWLLTILLMMPVTFTFSNLAVLYPHAGGTAFFIKQSFGNRFENFTSWLYLSVVPLGPPVVVITGANYLGSILNANDMQIFLICVIMLVLMLLMNFVGLKLVSNIQTAISVTVVGILISVIILAITKNPTIVYTIDLSANMEDMFIISKAITIVFWCFVGLEAIVHLSPEFKNVKRDFPKTIIISMSTVGIICLLLSLIVLNYGVYGNEQLDSNYLVPLLGILMGKSSRVFIATICFLTCFATVNLYILSFSRMMYSMSENGIIFKCFSKLSNRNVPLNALLLCYFCVFATIAIKFAFNVKLGELILYANSVFVSLYFLASIAGVVLLNGAKRYLAIISTIFCLLIYISLGYQAFYVIWVLTFSTLWDLCLSIYKKHISMKMNNLLK